jgi:hypothetical protein
MSLDEKVSLGAIVVTLIVMISLASWWLPQKWQGCQKIYDNRPAQIFCFLSNS